MATENMNECLNLRRMKVGTYNTHSMESPPLKAGEVPECKVSQPGYKFEVMPYPIEDERMSALRDYGCWLFTNAAFLENVALQDHVGPNKKRERRSMKTKREVKKREPELNSSVTKSVEKEEIMDAFARTEDDVQPSARDLICFRASCSVLAHFETLGSLERSVPIAQHRAV